METECLKQLVGKSTLAYKAFLETGALSLKTVTGHLIFQLCTIKKDSDLSKKKI